jgi:dihydrofolate reductase
MNNWNLIVACNPQNIIGINGTIPWRVPEDMKYFKEITTSHIVIMGRKTFESLPKSKLPNRSMIVLSNNTKYNNLEIPNTHFVTSKNKAIEKAESLSKTTGQKIFVIGGNYIYREFFDMCKTIYITHIYIEIDTNNKSITYISFNPSILNDCSLYKEIYRNEIQHSKNNIPFQMITYEKICK